MRVSGLASIAVVAAAVAWSQGAALQSATGSAAAGSADPASKEFFEARVRPVLVSKCYVCHTDAQMSGLRVDSREALVKGGNGGPALVPGDPEKSLLIEAIRQTGNLKMPKGGHLTEQEIGDLVGWVRAGAVWPASEKTQPTVAGAVPPNAGNDFFENKIRPILATNCYPCHTDAQRSGLRVDSRAALLKGGDTGPAIVPGDADKSLLVQAVRQTGTLKMPKGGHLQPQQIEDLATWVKMGAPWPAADQPVVTKNGDTFKVTPEQRAFWSFKPLHMPAEPALKDAKWAKTEIDKYVLAKLETQNLKPVKPADRTTLLRRVTLDLTGLPPTPEEIEAFDKDKSAGAYAKVVDRLLASPRYGERWGRHWLDVARYGEDDVRGLDPMGRGFMPFKGAYVFRDWTIKAFNDDMPYDFFVKAQLAGDLLEGKDRERAIPGTAFLGGGPWIWDQAEPIQGRADERNERIDAVSRGFLGLTVACARCHDHKYDPISQKDYYALGGVFASSTYKEYPRVSSSQVIEWQRTEQRILDLQEELGDFMRTESQQFSEILAHQSASYMVGAWKVSGKPALKLDEAAERDKLDPEVLRRWVAFLAKPPKHYPFLKDWQAMVASGGTPEEAKFLAGNFQKLVLSVLADAKKIKEENDIIKAKADVKKRSNHDANPNEFETDDQFCPGCSLELKSAPVDKAKLYSELFVRSVDSEDEEKSDPGVFAFRGNALQRQLSPEWSRHVDGMKAEIAKLEKELPKEYPFVHGVGDKAKPVNINVNLRGNPHSLGDEVPRRFLTVLNPDTNPAFQQGSGRLELAQKIVQSPLASRVIVNRIWKWHFGTGIVNTPDNFGQPGERPSNPELLEYLAVKFQQDGMSIKKLQREILLSSVYQLSADDSAENDEKDASNRLYWKFNRQRMDAEQIRDSILFVAGDLDTKVTNGPSEDFSEENHRRTVFCKVSRFRINNYLQVFDFPNTSFTAEQRFTTNVPVQRLYFMNNKFVYLQAGKFAERVYGKGSDNERIAEAYHLLYGRAPTGQELQLGLQFLEQNHLKPENDIQGQPTTAWKEYSRVLLSSNEFEFLN